MASPAVEDGATSGSRPPEDGAAELYEWRRVLAVACRGLAVGAGLHAGIRILAGITSGRLRDRPIIFLRRLIDGDTVRFASFVALSGATYKLIITYFRNKFEKLQGWHAAVAGLAAGLISAMDDPSRRFTFSLFLSARALGALITTLHRRGYLPTVPHFVTVALGLCQCLILVAVTRFPELLPQGYYRSVIRWALYYTEEKLQVYYRKPHTDFIPCNALMHEGTCHAWALTDCFNSLFMFFKLYLALYGIPTVLFKTKALIHSPVAALTSLLQNTCVSTLAFTMDATLVKYGLCLLRNAWGSPPPTSVLVPVLAGVMGLSGLLIERYSRRVEMVYYGLPQIFYSIWRILCIKKPLGLHKLPYGSVLVFSLSVAAIMHVFETEKESISPPINRALQFLLN